MAKAKYKKGKDGRWQTKVWDGTYGPDGIKHYVPVYSTKSSGDLEKTVNKMKADVENRKYVRPTEQDFVEYAKEWLKTYKVGREKATKAMYTNQQEISKKYWSLSGRCTKIAANTDMHTIIQSGNYGCANNDIANSLKNCPMDKAFVLHVYSSTGSGTDYYIIQEYTAYDASRRILNFYNTESKTWIAREFAFKS